MKRAFSPFPAGGLLAVGLFAGFSLLNRSLADPAGLDQAFGTGGIVSTGVGSGDDVAQAIAIQPDGKILVAGDSWNGADHDFLIGRYQAHGVPDPYFGGFQVTAIGADDRGRAIVLQSDGKIVVAGSAYNGSNYDFALVRYHPNGSLDYSFGTLGKVTTAIGSGNDQARAVVIQSDGKIIVAGSARMGATDEFALARYSDTGVLDPTFSTDGKTTLGTTLTHDYAFGVALTPIEKIVVGGYSRIISGGAEMFAVARLTAAGDPDTSFNGNGVVTTNVGGSEDHIHAVVVQPDGKIVAAGYAVEASTRKFALARYSTNGGLDNTFGVGGTVVTDLGPGSSIANALALQGDGKLVVAGEASSDFAVVRYNPTGSLDPGFCGAGTAIVPVGSGADAAYGVAVQSDDKVVLAGSTYNGSGYDLALVRLHGGPVPEIEVQYPAGNVVADGAAEVGFGDTSVTTGPSVSRDITIRNTGSGDLTGLFVSIDGANADEFSTLVYPSLNLAAGETTSMTVRFLPTSEGLRTAVLHIASNDTNENPFDLTLSGTGKVPPTITTTSPLVPGMVGTPYNFAFTAVGGTPPYSWEVIAGAFQDPLSLSGPGMLVGTPTVAGTRDLTIRVTGADGRWSTFDCSLTVMEQLELGDLDPAFSGDGKTTLDVATGHDSGRAVAVQADGKILVAGYAQIGGVEDFALARLRPDGTLDSSFGTGGVVTTAVGTFRDYARCIALQADGKILVAGEVSNGSAYDFGVVRYMANGAVDASFGVGGIARVSLASSNDYPRGIFVRGDGKIVVAGAAHIDFGVTRLHPDGSLDTSFGTAGVVMTDFGTNTFDYAEAAMMQSDGKIVVAGRVGTATHGDDFGLIRYEENGSLDSTFGTGGKVSTTVGGGSTGDICYGLASQPDGKILAVGDSNTATTQIAAVRYQPNGSLDTSFATGGIGFYSIYNDDNHARAVAVQPDGAIVIAGYANSKGLNDNFGCLRLLPNGSPDGSVGYLGGMTASFSARHNRAYAVALQNDGGIVLAGEADNGTNTDIAVVRFVGMLAPEIVVEEPVGTPLVDGLSAIDFGSVAPGDPPQARVFLIRNVGTAALTGVHAGVDGANATDFSITQPVTTVLVPGASIPFTITYAPAATGLRLASLHVISNDANEASFDIALAGGVSASPLRAWRFTHFGSTENLGNGADSFDYDCDDVENLLEYAFRGDPKLANPGIKPVIPPVPGSHRTIAFRCDASCTDITYTVQASPSLAAGTWTDIARSTGGAAVQPLNGLSTVSDSGNGLRVAAVTASASLFPNGKGFLRVVVSY